MSDTPEVHQPLDEVRKTFHVDWYRCPIDRPELMALLERSDLRGWCLAAGHLVLSSPVRVHLRLIALTTVYGSALP